MTIQTTTPTELQIRPMATTIPQADLVIRTVAGFAAGSGDKYETLHNILITPHEDHVVVVATDRYRLASAKVSKDLWTGNNDNPSLISVGGLDGGAWVKALKIAVPQGDKRYPNVEQFINRDGHSTFSASVTPLHGGAYSATRDLANLRKWGYWDGERRRPQGLVELTHTYITVSYRLGMNLKDDARMPYATLWEGRTRPLVNIVPPTPTTQGIGSNDVIPKTLGVYNPTLFPDWQYIDTIRYHGGRRALYLAGGVFEYVVMPIVVPVYEGGAGG